MWYLLAIVRAISGIPNSFVKNEWESSKSWNTKSGVPTSRFYSLIKLQRNIDRDTRDSAERKKSNR